MGRAPRRTRVVIFGAGLGGVTQWMALARLPAIDIVACLDNDARRHGTTLFGTPIHGVDRLASLAYDYIVVASIHHAAIRAQLRAAGVPARRLIVLRPAADVRRELVARGAAVGSRRRVPRAPARRVAIFGAGAAGLQAWAALAASRRVEVVAFIDNDRRRWGTSFLGAPVRSLESLAPDAVDHIVVASVHATAILRQLLGAGVPMERVATPIVLEWRLAAEARQREAGDAGGADDDLPAAS